MVVRIAVPAESTRTVTVEPPSAVPASVMTSVCAPSDGVVIATAGGVVSTVKPRVAVALLPAASDWVTARV